MVAWLALASVGRVCADEVMTTPALAPITDEQSVATFERLKGLAGTWVGESTKGWRERIRYEVIARDSCVLESSFDAHPGEKMLTLFHLDGSDLLLTHYCVARNQPRLRASAICADGRTVEFTFRDMTGGPRDMGHMDRCVMTFGDDTLTTQWFWSAKGKETPMEVITQRRVVHRRLPR
jgi:hypothetical protein